jgi:hypothetical protein
MSERSDSGEKAAGTLLGVPAPRVDNTADSSTRKPVFVRAGTSVADEEGEPPPVPRMALPSRPPLPEVPLWEKPSELPPALTTDGRVSLGPGAGLKQLARRYPVLWMAGAPALLALLVVGVVALSHRSKDKSATAAVSTSSTATLDVPKVAPVAAKPTPKKEVSELESKPLGSLSAGDLLELAQNQSERRRDATQALRKKLAENPSLASDKATQTELFKLTGDAETARDALAAMAAIDGSNGADMLYEVWTGTSGKTETTELARALVYSPDIRPKATPALAIALELRQAETCEQFQKALPKALTDGDRRSLTPLMKLGSKRGCGPKKSQDCFACLRGAADEITATINAVKSRRGPAFNAP